MSIESKRLEMAVSMGQRKAGRFAKRAKTVRASSRELLDAAIEDEVPEWERELAEAEAQGEFDDER